MKQKRLIDLRNIYKVSDMQEHGFQYISVGRPEIAPDAEKKIRAVN